MPKPPVFKVLLRVDIASRVGVSENTVGRVARQFVETGGDGKAWSRAG